MIEIFQLKKPLHHNGKRGAGSVVPCDHWPGVYAWIASRIGGQAGALLDIALAFSDMDDMVSECATCRANLEHWGSQARCVCLELRPLSFYVK
jgi:hypothetical protein